MISPYDIHAFIFHNDDDDNMKFWCHFKELMLNNVS